MMKDTLQGAQITVKGISPLLLHRFSEEEAQKATSGIRSGRNQELLPREIADSYLYKLPDGTPYFPADNLYRALIDGGRKIKVGRASLSTQRDSQIPSMLWIIQTYMPIVPNTWEVDSRPVCIPATGGRILRHRPRFDEWALSFSLLWDSTLISEMLLRDLITITGRVIGIGDFRPARRGTFGRFTMTLWEQNQ